MTIDTGKTQEPCVKGGALRDVAQKFELGLSRKEITPLDRLRCHQHLNRNWSRFLKTREYRVMSYILDRSVDWGYSTFTACHSNVVNGTDDYSGIGLGLTQYKEVLSILEKKGAIFREGRARGTTIGVNLLWVPNKELLDVSSETKNNSGIHHDFCSRKSGPRKVGNPATEEGNNKKRNNNTLSPTAQTNEFSSGEEKTENCIPLQNVMKTKEKAQDASRTKKTDKISAAKAKTKPNSYDFALIWSEALRDTFPSTATSDFTVAARGRINQAIKRYGTKNTVSFLEQIGRASGRERVLRLV